MTPPQTDAPRRRGKKSRFRPTRQQVEQWIAEGKCSPDALDAFEPWPVRQRVVSEPAASPVSTPQPNPIDLVTACSTEGARRATIWFPFLPPSWNTMTGTKAAISRKARQKAMCEFVVEAQKPEPFAVPVYLFWYVIRPDADRCDCDNLCTKYMQDALVRAGVIPDDTSAWVQSFPQVIAGPVKCTKLIIMEQPLDEGKNKCRE